MATIDLSQLPAPNLVYEIIDLEATAYGITLDIEFYAGMAPSAPGDPIRGVALMIAKREAAIRSRINEAARGVFLSSMEGPALDQAGALFDTERLILDALATPPVYEGDDPYRRAIHAAPQAFGTGSQYRYERAALASDDRIASVYAAVPSPTSLSMEWLPVLGTDPGDHPEIENNILKSLEAKDSNGFEIRMVTDTVAVAEAIAFPIDITATLYTAATADTDAITAAISERLTESSQVIRQVRAPLPRSLVMAVLDVDGVESITLTSPAADQPSTQESAWDWGALTLDFQVATWV